MAKPYKPEGYASVSAYIMVDGAQKLIDFLRATFPRYKIPLIWL